MRLLSAAALLVLALTGCSRSVVEVRNLANAPIENIEITVAGKRLGIDRLGPGDSRRIRYSTKTVDMLTVSFRIQATQRKCANKAYATPPFEDEFIVSISSDGKCAISHRPLPS